MHAVGAAAGIDIPGQLVDYFGTKENSSWFQKSIFLPFNGEKDLIMVKRKT